MRIINKQEYVGTWCPICENRVSEKYKNTAELLNHIRTCHPANPQNEKIDAKQQKVRFQSLKKTAKWLNPFKKTSQRPKKLYEQSLSGCSKDFRNERILCPACNVESPPLLFEKSSQKFIADCRFGTICLLGCWPLCFVPLMISRDKRVRMVCPLCGYDYGTYDVRNAKDSTIIVDTAETLLGTTEILSKTSSNRSCQSNKNKLNIETCEQSTNVEKSILDGTCVAEATKNEARVFNRCDVDVECPKNEKNVKEAESFPTEQFDYAVGRVDRKMKPMETETCDFCLAEVDSDSSSQWRQKQSARRQPISKCYDDREYSTIQHRQCPTNRNTVSMVCQHSRCGQKNLNDCCGTNENTKGIRNGIISRYRANLRHDQSCVQHDDWTNEHLPLFANDENFYGDGNYDHEWL